MTSHNQPEDRLPASTRLGYVQLTVSDLDRSVDFYQHALGFKLHRQAGLTAHLGAGQEDLLLLTGQPDAVRAPRSTGLYHFAILVPSRVDLAGSLQNLIDTQTRLQGGADHLVSEALYLADPDGNGIEIYRDRPSGEWLYENNQLKMSTDPLDFHGILAELPEQSNPWQGLHAETKLGHMHLHVAQLPSSTRFYSQVLGFELMRNYGPSAAFLAAGGYHHHVGLNTWNGVGAPPPPPQAVGLRYFTIQVPGQNEFDKLLARLVQAGISPEIHNGAIFVRDPSQNGIKITSG
jgi:catechol 2,3-dioxygenase